MPGGRVRHEYELLLGNHRPRRALLAAGLSVRNVRADDADGVATMLLEAYRGTIDDEGEDFAAARAFVVDVPEQAQMLPASWLALDGERVVSAVLIQRWRGHPLVHVVATHPSYKGKGVGSRLVERALEALVELGEERLVAFITEGNTPSERLFARLGFVRVVRPERESRI